MTPLRFANPSPPSGWIEDFHLQAVVHTRHTRKKRPASRPPHVLPGEKFHLRPRAILQPPERHGHTSQELICLWHRRNLSGELDQFRRFSSTLARPPKVVPIALGRAGVSAWGGDRDRALGMGETRETQYSHST